MTPPDGEERPPVDQPSGFGRLWSAVVASNLGDGLVLAAFPLLAARITRDPVAISGIAVAAGLPWLLVGPVAGAVVDRFDRRRLMVLFDLLRAAALAVFGLMVVAGAETMWALYAVVFFITVGETIVDTSSQAILPALVPRQKLDRANGTLFAAMTAVNRFIGPPVGGWLFGIGVALPIFVDSASFAVAALFVLSISGRFAPVAAGDPREPIRASIAEGMRWLWSHRPIRGFAIGAAILNVGIVAGEAILVLYAADHLGLSGAGFGALFVATAAGYAAGSSAASWVTARFDRRRIIAVSVISIAGSLAVIGVAPHWAVAAVGLAGTGIASGLWDVIAVSYRQAAVPDRLLGRIMAAYRVIAYGSFPIGAVVGGATAAVAGTRAPFFVGAVVVAAALPYVMASLRGVSIDPIDASA